MPKGIAIDLSFISTEELIDELTERHEELIVIREDRKAPTWLNIRAKTSFGKYGNKEAGFDVVRVLNLLHTTAEQLLKDHLSAEKAEDDGLNDPQNSDNSS